MNKKKIITIIMIIILNINIFSAKTHILGEDINIKYDKLNLFLKELNYDLEKILIVEAYNLDEFTKITDKPYSYYSAFFIPEKNIIITQPFRILKEKNIYEITLTHEIIHYYLTKYTILNEFEQESVINKLLNLNIKKYNKFDKFTQKDMFIYIKNERK